MSAFDVSSIYCDDNIEEVDFEGKEIENEDDKKTLPFPLSLNSISSLSFQFNSYYAIHTFESVINSSLFNSQQISLFILFCCLKTHL